MLIKQWLAERLRPLSLGEQGERHAARYLRRICRYRIVATRRRLRYGEFDVIVIDGLTVVFVEVKTRRSETGPRPALAVDDLRRRRMTRAATAFLKSHGLLEYPARFDIVEVVWPIEQRRPQIQHHQNAFPAEGRGQFFR
jgi:putative endonuclease